MKRSSRCRSSKRTVSYVSSANVAGPISGPNDRTRRYCGDSPCVEYSFIGKSPAKRPYSVHDMRELFLSFFEKNGHTRISPYPIVARWRDDVFLVGASIYDFQPYVTEGMIPPPANPLVVSQPSIRFTDIDNVGPTLGRHDLMFEMGGAHAFNYPDKEVYWMDQTIRYHHQLADRRVWTEIRIHVLQGAFLVWGRKRWARS